MTVCTSWSLPATPPAAAPADPRWPGRMNGQQLQLGSSAGGRDEADNDGRTDGKRDWRCTEVYRRLEDSLLHCLGIILYF